MAILAGEESFYKTAGPKVTSDLGVSMFTDMEMPESIGGKRMSSFESSESLVHRYDQTLEAELIKKINYLPYNRIKNLLNSSSVVHDILIEELAELGSINFKKAVSTAKQINDREKAVKPWILLNVNN